MSISYCSYPGVLFFFQARVSPVESPIGAQPIGRHPTLHASTRSIIEPVNSCRARLCRGPAGPPSNLRQLLPRRSPSARRPPPPPIRTPAPPELGSPPGRRGTPEVHVERSETESHKCKKTGSNCKFQVHSESSRLRTDPSPRGSLLIICV